MKVQNWKDLIYTPLTKKRVYSNWRNLIMLDFVYLKQQKLIINEWYYDKRQPYFEQNNYNNLTWILVHIYFNSNRLGTWLKI